MDSRVLLYVVIGGVLFLSVVLLVIMAFFKRKRKNNAPAEEFSGSVAILIGRSTKELAFDLKGTVFIRYSDPSLYLKMEPFRHLWQMTSEHEELLKELILSGEYQVGFWSKRDCIEAAGANHDTIFVCLIHGQFLPDARPCFLDLARTPRDTRQLQWTAETPIIKPFEEMTGMDMLRYLLLKEGIQYE